MSGLLEIREALEETLSNFTDLFRRVEQLEAAPLITSGSGGGAPIDATYLVNSANAILTNEIVVTAAQGRIIYGDGVPTWTTLNIGANGTVLQSNGAIPGWQTLSSAGIAPNNASYITVNLEGGLTSERNLNINNGLTFTDNGANNSYDVNLGTPSDVTSSTVNSVTAASHTHALDTTGVTPGTYGNATNVGQFTVDSKGRITAASNVSLVGGFAPTNATYLVVSLDATLTNERNLVINNGLTFTDGGANAAYTVNLGTPTTLDTTTANAVTASSHSHQITHSTTGVASPTSIIAAYDTVGQLTAVNMLVSNTGAVATTGLAAQIIFSNATPSITIISDMFLANGLYIPEYIYHTGDTDTYLRYQTDQISLVAGGATMIDTIENTTDEVHILPSGGKSSIGTATTSTAQLTIDVGVGLTGIEIDRAAGASSIIASSSETNMFIDSNGGTLRLNNYVSDDVRMVTGGGNVGINISPNAKLDIDQSSTTAIIPVLQLDQADVSEQCINVRSNGSDVDINILTVDVTGTPKFWWDESEDSFRFTKKIFSQTAEFGYFSGTSPAATVVINQEDVSGAKAVLELNQLDTSEQFINFIGSTGGGTTTPISTAAIGTYSRKLKVTLNGVGTYWIPVYT